MQAVAKLNNSKGSPRKARLLVDIIRGVEVNEAMNRMKFSAKEASVEMEKLLLSAVDNWKQKNEGLDPEDSDLYVKEAFVNGGRVLKRFQPAPHGRAHRIRKRSHHVTIVVDSRQPAADFTPAVEEATEAVAEKKETKTKKKTKKG